MSSEVAGPSTSCGQDQVDEDVTSQSKRMRLSTKSIEITDLNNNCLEHIFKFLNLNDLLNVAGTCKKFHSAANYPFSSNFGKKQFHLRYTYIERGSSAFSIDTFENDIYIRKLKIYLKCLRTFGHLINKLCINYDTMPIRDEIDLYINQYCSDYVKEIVFCWSMKGAMKNLTKPFPNVWSLAFSSCYLEDEITNFNEKFPKMKRLKFSGSNTIATRKCIEMNFSHLENLCIVDVDTHQSDTFFQPNNIATCIRLNPALRELEIGGELLNISFIQSVRKHLQHIEFLGIQLQSPKSLQLNTGTISLNIKRLKVDIRSGSMNPARMPKIPLVSNQLEEFSIKACNLWVKESLMDFIKKTPEVN
ncbi:uncharacterized protein LOC116337041 [Contarinia nasturtii]|uniref:uncharacterized protein LOC116337041 n=1 Tax=Contarinia nasturtii TaxID=265458 RepID=UPI0012D4AA46|nr:uncharacterized protein LOC116337041 [Contarinia nasturtii]